MSCAACGHENRPGAKFCEECAAPITRVCACGSELRPTAKFCDECGAAIRVSGVKGLGARENAESRRPISLGKDAIGQLLADLLGTDPSLGALVAPIHARTGGNPFFTEEVAQSLIESGHLQGSRGAYRLVSPIERLEVPATVQAILAARIDRLPEREKRLLGDLSAAESAAREAIALCRYSQRGSFEAEAHGILARALLRRDGVPAREAVEGALAAAAALIERTGAKILAPALCEWRAELAAVLGDNAMRLQLLREAHQLYEQIGAPLQARRLGQRLSESTFCS